MKKIFESETPKTFSVTFEANSKGKMRNGETYELKIDENSEPITLQNFHVTLREAGRVKISGKNVYDFHGADVDLTIGMRKKTTFKKPENGKITILGMEGLHYIAIEG